MEEPQHIDLYRCLKVLMAQNWLVLELCVFEKTHTFDTCFEMSVVSNDDGFS
jgi:hypothetical protein